jgi:4-hydroxy-tetrahydrodipicolinate synthase
MSVRVFVAGKRWAGIFPALSTPTDRRGRLDEAGYRSMVRRNIDWGAHGLCASIIAGEFYKFTEEERMRVFEVAVDAASGEAPVLAGVSHTGTEPAVMLAKHAEDVGADGLVMMPPFFGRNMSRAMIFSHVGAVAARCGLPIMFQDAEDATGVNISPTLYMALAEEYSNVVSVKVEGSGTLDKVADTRRLLGDRLTIFGGMAARLMIQEMELGADGNIPDACLTDVLVGVYNYMRAGDARKAKEIFGRYKVWVDFLGAHAASSAEVEKETLRLRGVIKSSQTRAPNIPLGDEAKRELKELLKGIVG